MFDFLKRKKEKPAPINVGKIHAEIICQDRTVNITVEGRIRSKYFSAGVIFYPFSAKEALAEKLLEWKNMGFIPLTDGTYIPFSSIKEIKSRTEDYYVETKD